MMRWRSAKKLGTWIRSASFPFTYSYNYAGALTGETYPSGRSLTIGYDAANRQNAVNGTMSGQNTTYINSAGYAPSGGLLSYLTNNNLLTLNQLYNMHQQVSYLAVARGNNYQGQNYFAQTMDWGTSNNNGVRLNGKKEYISNNAALPTAPTFSQTFSYDGVNRLLSASDTGGWSQTYSYDQYGNMWMPPTSNPLPSLSGAAPTSNIYNANNQNPNVSYDLAGNQTSLGSLTLSYDGENRQSQIANLGGGTGTFQYDGLRHRVVKSLPSQTTPYVYDAFGQLAAEYYSGTKPTPPCTTCFLTYDYLGNVRMVTDAQANIVARHDFAPFGQEIPSGTGGRGSQWGATTDVDMKFTGQIRDQEASEDFFNARYFAFALGRFNSPDPGNAGASLGNSQSWNGYAYGLNNPLIFVDPSGKDCVTFDDGSKGLDPDRPQGGCGSLDENGNDSQPEEADVTAQQGSLLNYIYTISTNQIPIYVPNDLPLSKNARQVLTQVYQSTWPIAQPLCSSGAFVYAGVVEGKRGVGHVEVLAVPLEVDSKGGVSSGVLAEGGVGPLSAGFEGAYNWGTGSVQYSGLAFANKNLGGVSTGDASVGLLGDTQGNVGVYGGWGVGVGVYGRPSFINGCPGK